MNATTKPFRGGRVFTDDDAPPDAKPQRLRYPCFADGCPMAGRMFMAGTDKAGTCAWHYGVPPTEIPKVTRVLQDWQCVAFEIDAAWHVLSGELAADPGGIDAAMRDAWARLQPLTPGWEAQLAPGHRTNRAGLQYRETYGDWARKLEAFIGGRVQEVLSTHRRRDAA